MIVWGKEGGFVFFLFFGGGKGTRPRGFGWGRWWGRGKLKRGRRVQLEFFLATFGLFGVLDMAAVVTEEGVLRVALGDLPKLMKLLDNSEEEGSKVEVGEVAGEDGSEVGKELSATPMLMEMLSRKKVGKLSEEFLERRVEDGEVPELWRSLVAPSGPGRTADPWGRDRFFCKLYGGVGAGVANKVIDMVRQIPSVLACYEEEDSSLMTPDGDFVGEIKDFEKLQWDPLDWYKEALRKLARDSGLDPDSTDLACVYTLDRMIRAKYCLRRRDYWSTVDVRTGRYLAYLDGSRSLEDEVDPEMGAWVDVSPENRCWTCDAEGADGMACFDTKLCRTVCGYTACSKDCLQKHRSSRGCHYRNRAFRPRDKTEKTKKKNKKKRERKARQREEEKEREREREREEAERRKEAEREAELMLATECIICFEEGSPSLPCHESHKLCEECREGMEEKVCPICRTGF